MRSVAAVIVVVAKLILASQGQFLIANCGTGSNSPWLVFVQGPNFSCGGSLITDRYVMTAAHCMQGKPNQMTIRVAGSTFNVVSVTKHPGYGENSRGVANDIALLKLERAVQFNDNTKPICVYSAKSAERDQLLQSTQQFTLTYWENRVGDPKKGVVNRFDKNECGNCFNFSLGPKQMCGESATPDMDRGNALGPLGMMTNEGGPQRVVQVGIPSFGFQYHAGPTVYTNVLDYSDWIASMVQN